MDIGAEGIKPHAGGFIELYVLYSVEFKYRSVFK